MSETAQRLKVQLEQLPQAERAELADFLLQTLDPEFEEKQEAAFKAELNRRGEEILRGEVVGEPAEKVFRELREKHQ